MKARPVVLREAAIRDVDETIAYYLQHASEQVALDFIDALERAYTHLGRHPATGSSLYAHELDLPGLRSWRVEGHPHLIFYVERDDHIDVWRVLHGKRDIPASMREPEER